MYKAVFQNSKAALLFAGMTIFGAVSMIGSPEDKGVLNKAVERFGDERETFAENAQAFAESQSFGDAPSNPEAGWGSSKSSVFGDYDPDAAAESDFYAPAPTPGSAKTPKVATPARKPGPQPVIADSEGIPVPGPDDDGPVTGAPFISSRQMTLEPK